MINKKNIGGFFLLFFCASIVAILIWFFISKDNNGNINANDHNNGTEQNPIATPTPTSKYDKETTEKLNMLDNINESIDYFIMDNLDRYLSYKEKNPDISNKKIIVLVNAGLDYSFYTNVVNSPYLNTTYLIANKHYFLGSDYVPENMSKINSDCSNGSNSYMVEEAKLAFESLCRAASNQGYRIRSISAYRSYSYQNTLYNNYVARDGKSKADTYSARPGYSEHQTGLATDVDNYSTTFTSFDKTKEYSWMQDNAYLYGFILRYPKDKVDITGYQYESWHYRYVGTDIAKYIHENNITYEEYYEMFIANKK